MPKEDYERRDANAEVRNSTVTHVIIMRKENILIPKPKSKFLSIQCSECQEKMIIFSHTTADIKCKSCGTLIATRRGGKAKILAKFLTTLD
jgi:small subunit ribosomal protein S27e